MIESCAPDTRPLLEVKFCKCGLQKTITYVKDRSGGGKMKRSWICRPCEKIYHKNFRTKNSESIRAKSKRTPEKSRQYNQRHWLVNGKQALLKLKERYASDPLFRERNLRLSKESRERHIDDRLRKSAEFYQNNKEKYLNWNRRRRNNPETRAIVIAYSSRYRSIRNSSCKNAISPKEMAKLSEAIKECFYCGQQKPLTWDHVSPISKGGTHTFNNMVRACKSCNSSKQHKDFDAWIERLKNSRPNHPVLKGLDQIIPEIQALRSIA